MEQCDIVVYLQKREKELYMLMNLLSAGSPMYLEAKAKHIELLNILKDFKINIINDN